jgi:hypothetical protein
MTRRRLCAIFASVVVLCGAMSLSCSRSDHACSDGNVEGTPIDPSLMAFLSRARSAHHLADLKEDNEPEAAIAAMVSVVEGPIPNRSGEQPAEAREVIADTQARIADLQSRLMQFDAALRRIDAALGWMTEVSYFRGHLFETRGLVEQRSSDELAKRGDTAAAQAAKSRALVAFETAMQIQAEVIRQTPPDPSVLPAQVAPAAHPSVPVSPMESTTAGAVR